MNVLLLAGMLLLSAEAIQAEAEPTAAEVIAKSDAAYAAVNTYVGTTTVNGKAEVGLLKLDQVASAKVTFARPGKLHIQGMTSDNKLAGQAGKPFTIVSDGTTTWQAWALQNNGGFTQSQNLSMALAAMTGVANGAANNIPAALMKSEGAKTAGHDPFMVARLSSATVAGHEAIDGVDCYKLVAKDARLGTVTLWIDSKTYLLRQMTREMNEATLAAAAKSAEEAMKKFGQARPNLPANMPKITSKIDTYSFAIDTIDGPVDQNLFTNPIK